MSFDIDFKSGATEEEIKKKIYEYGLSLDISDGNYVCDYGKKECTADVKLITSYYVQLFDMDYNPLLDADGNKVILPFTNLPTMTITQKLSDFIN